jgi:hypothetical protein
MLTQVERASPFRLAAFRRRFRRQWLAYAPLALYLVWLMFRYRWLRLHRRQSGHRERWRDGNRIRDLDQLARIEGTVAEFVVVRAITMGAGSRSRENGSTAVASGFPSC